MEEIAVLDYISSKEKSPAEIFIKWAFTEKYDYPNYCATIRDWYLKRCNQSCDKRTFIAKYKNSSLETIYIDAFVNPSNYDSEWIKEIETKWQNYLKTINNGKDQLQREEISESSGPGTAGFGSYDRNVYIEASGCDCNFEAGYEISGERIDVSEADLSFGFDCSL